VITTDLDHAGVRVCPVAVFFDDFDLLGMAYPWMQDAWLQLPADSRAKCDEWVLAGRTRGMAVRRARTVTQRCCTGRPWTDNRCLRRAQAVRDYFAEAPDVPSGADRTTGMG
jgi:hypothetical protein